MILSKGLCRPNILIHWVFNAIVFLLLLRPGLSFATNGLNLIGFGTESISMGGADLAVARDTTALNTNPSGLTQITQREFDLFFGGLLPLSVVHRDMLGNEQAMARSPKLLGDFGYAQRLSNRTITVGIGLFAQGGAGVEYNDLVTAFGTRDDLSSSFRIAKVTPGIAFQVSQTLSLGVSLSLLYADLTQKVFPNTSFFNSADPSKSFFGFELDGLHSVNKGIRLGALYRIKDSASVGMAYSSQVALNLKEGRLISDLTGLGLGKVTYRDVRVTGLHQPQELGIGLLIKPVKKLRVATEINWIDWSEALNASTLTAINPENPAAPSIQEATTILKWRDQYVVAIGAAYEPNEKIILRAGYNYGKNPIPKERINPFFAAIGQHHLTFGAGYRLNSRWQFDGGLEFQFREKTTYTNVDLPFGANSEAEVEVIGAQFMISRRW